MQLLLAALTAGTAGAAGGAMTGAGLAAYKAKDDKRKAALEGARRGAFAGGVAGAGGGIVGQSAHILGSSFSNHGRVLADMSQHISPDRLEALEKLLKMSKGFTNTGAALQELRPSLAMSALSGAGTGLWGGRKKEAGWWAAADGVIGDSAADIMGEAVDKIRAEYEDHLGREPSSDELRAVFGFVSPEKVAARPPPSMFKQLKQRVVRAGQTYKGHMTGSFVQHGQARLLKHQGEAAEAAKKLKTYVRAAGGESAHATRHRAALPKVRREAENAAAQVRGTAESLRQDSKTRNQVRAATAGTGLATLGTAGAVASRKKEAAISLSSSLPGTSSALKGKGAGMAVLKKDAGRTQQMVGAMKTNTKLRAEDGAVWQPKLGGIGGVVGAMGGVRGSGHKGVASGVSGAFVGHQVGDYVLPAVYRALLADPEMKAIALPAALLASGIAGEVSGILVSKFFPEKKE